MSVHPPKYYHLHKFLTHEDVLRKEMRNPRFAFWWYLSGIRWRLWRWSKTFTEWLEAGL